MTHKLKYQTNTKMPSNMHHCKVIYFHLPGFGNFSTSWHDEMNNEWLEVLYQHSEIQDESINFICRSEHTLIVLLIVM